MKRLTFVTCLFLACAVALSQPGSSTRTTPCKTTEIASLCFMTYGQLASGHDHPSFMFLELRTNRLFEIYSFPPNVEHALWDSAPGPWPNVVIGWFELCPLDDEKVKPKQFRTACIESAKDLLVKTYE